MPRTGTGGFQDGFIEIVKEQLIALRKDLDRHDEAIRRHESRASDERAARAETARRIAQLEELLPTGSHENPLPSTQRQLSAVPPLADANSVVALIREKGAMHYVAIHRELLERGFKIGGEGNANTLLSRYFNDARLKRVARGTYALSEQEDASADYDAKRGSETPKVWRYGVRGAQGESLYLGNRNVRILAGSTARPTNGRMSQGALLREKQHRRLIEDGVLIQDGSVLRFVRDLGGLTPSAAASLISGTSTNGWKAWINDEGKTLDMVYRSGNGS